MKQKPTRPEIQARLKRLKVGEQVQAGSYTWRKRDTGARGIASQWERVDDPHYTQPSTRLCDIILEILNIGGKVKWPGKKPRAQRRSTIEHAGDLLRKRLEAIDRRLTVEQENINDTQARMKRLEAERDELNATLQGLPGSPTEEEQS